MKFSTAFWTFYFCITIALLLCCCAELDHTSDVPDSLPAVGGALDVTEAHVKSAEQITQAVKPFAGAKAALLIDQQSKEHQAALGSIGDGRKSLALANRQREELADENATKDQRIEQITSGWGYRLQKFVQRWTRIILTIVALHFVLGIAGLFVPGEWGALLARFAVYLNPFTWFQAARDNYFFRVLAPAATPTATTSAVPAAG